MALHKIRGVKAYMADDSGLKDVATTSVVGSIALQEAQKLARNAEAIGHSTYEAKPANVSVGWANDLRAGAIVTEVSHDFRDSRDSVLLRVAESMNVRNP